MKENDVFEILIVEDDDGHAELIREGLEDVGFCNPIQRFKNGLKAWEFLNKETISSHNYLILLDINMPVMNGIEFLKKVKAEEKFKNIPIIMLTTTDDPREVKECYNLGCNFYVTKPIDFVAFAENLRRLGLFIQIIKL
ncbi:MAG: response regulator [Spirochaetales bacterium]|nr:response regulator [Spirochaetales bacterium]